MKTPILRPATEAVLFGFERIGMVIRIAWLPIVLVIGLYVTMFSIFVGGDATLPAGIDSNNPERMIEGLLASPGFMSFYILQAAFMPLAASLILSCVYVAATRASTLTDYEPPNLPFYFAIGGREIRYFIVRLLYTILAIVVTVFVGAIGAGVVVLAVGAVETVTGEGSAVVMALVGALVLWLILIWLWILLRFLPVLPIAAVENRIAFGDAWKMTKGNFWRLLLSGAMFIAILQGVLMVFILALFVPAAVVLGLVGVIGASVAGPGAFIVLAPLAIIGILALIVFAAFSLAAESAFPARIYAYLSGCGDACRL